MTGSPIGSERAQAGAGAATKVAPLLAAALLAALAGCSPGGDEDAAAQAAPAYQVPDSACPQGWAGLTVTTDNEAEVEFLDDLPACADASGARTYLKNQSDAVWVLQATSATAGTATPVGRSLTQESFVAAVGASDPTRVILVPGAQLTVDLRPDQFEWLIDLPLSFAWQAHDVVAGKIAGAGQGAALAAFQRRSPAGNALAVCTLAALEHARTIESLEEADSSEVLLDGLGLGAATHQCRLRAAEVTPVDVAGRPTNLADELARLQSETKILEHLDGRLSVAQRAAKVLGLGLKFVR